MDYGLFAMNYVVFLKKNQWLLAPDCIPKNNFFYDLNINFTGNVNTKFKTEVFPTNKSNT